MKSKTSERTNPNPESARWQRSDRIALLAVLISMVTLALNYQSIVQLVPHHKLVVVASNFNTPSYGDQEYLSTDLIFQNRGTRSEIITEASFILPFPAPAGVPMTPGMGPCLRWPNVPRKIMKNLDLASNSTVYYTLEQVMPIKFLLEHGGQEVAVRIVALRPNGVQVAQEILLARFHPGTTSEYTAVLLNPGPVNLFSGAHPYLGYDKMAAQKPEIESRKQ